MKKEENESADKVTVPKQELIALLNAARKIRTGFLMCAPRFASGSHGESMVFVANTMGGMLDDFERLIAAERVN